MTRLRVQAFSQRLIIYGIYRSAFFGHYADPFKPTKTPAHIIHRPFMYRLLYVSPCAHQVLIQSPDVVLSLGREGDVEPDAEYGDPGWVQ